MLKPSGLLIPDKPTTELVELESQLYAEIMAIPETAAVCDAIRGLTMLQMLKTVRKVLKRRVEAQ